MYVLSAVVLFLLLFCLQGVEVVRDRHQAAVRLYNMVKRETAGTALDVSALAQVKLIEVNNCFQFDAQFVTEASSAKITTNNNNNNNDDDTGGFRGEVG